MCNKKVNKDNNTLSVAKRFYDNSYVFFKSAEKLAEEKKILYVMPAFYLYRHSIELIMKSILLLKVSNFKEKIYNLKNIHLIDINININIIEHDIEKIIKILNKLSSEEIFFKEFDKENSKIIQKALCNIYSYDKDGLSIRYPLSSWLEKTHGEETFTTYQSKKETGFHIDIDYETTQNHELEGKALPLQKCYLILKNYYVENK